MSSKGQFYKCTWMKYTGANNIYFSELQIIGSTEDNLKIIFLISQY